LKDATLDRPQVKEWWDLDPGANVGIATGIVSDLLVLDVDVDKNGFKSLVALEQDHGELPPTITANTGGGGKHYYFKSPDRKLKNKVGFRPGLDIRTDGGYVVAPPSSHVSGKSYAWENSPADQEPADAPDWLIKVITSKEKKARKAQKSKNGTGDTQVPEGGRNDYLTSMAGLLRRGGLSEAEIIPALLEVNHTRCDPPLSDDEVEEIACSICGYPAPERDFHNTDLGNAQRLAHRHGDALRHVPGISWLAWDGRRWVKDTTGGVERKAKETVLAMYNEVAGIEDVEVRRAFIAHVRKSESERGIRAMVSLARSEQQLVARVEDLDNDPYLFNVENGTLDLRTGDLRPHAPEDQITKLAPVAYDPNARCEEFLTFLEDIFDGNQALIEFMQRAIGYALTGLVVEQCFFFLHGTGANGKSTLLLLLQHIMGDYAKQAAPSLLLAKRWEDHPTGVADLMGARLVVTTEIDQGKALAEGLVKQLTGGDRIKARFMRKDFFEFDPTHKIFLAANHKPNVKGGDHAIWRRIKLIPFTITIPEEFRDPLLLTKLKEEAPGVLAWAMRGCLKWQKEGLGAPDEVVQATDGYRQEMDITGRFVEETCEVGPNFKAPIADLYDAYERWCNRSGEFVVSKRIFGERLSERGYQPKRGTGGTAIRLGLRLKRVRGPRVANSDATSRFSRNRRRRKGSYGK